jgi:hypothetical protein
MPQSEAPVPIRHVDEKPARRGRPPKYHTAEDRVAAGRQRKLGFQAQTLEIFETL